MKKQKLKKYFNRGVLFLGISLLLWNCEKNEPSIGAEAQQERKIKRISLSDFKDKVLPNKQYENLEKYFYSNASLQSKTSDDLNSDSNITILTHDIVYIEQDDISYYTFKILTETEGDEFYNLIVQVNAQEEIIKSEFLKYTPSDLWLADTSQPFTGFVKLIENDFLSVNNLFSKSGGQCVTSITFGWECEAGWPHTPEDCKTASNPDGECDVCNSQYYFNVEYGPCDQIIDAGDSNSGGGDSFDNDGFPVDDDPIGGNGGGDPNGSPTIPEIPCENQGTGLTGGTGDCYIDDKIDDTELIGKEKCLNDHLRKNGTNYVRNLLSNFDGDNSEFDINIKSKDHVYSNTSGTNVEVNGKTIYTSNSNIIRIEINSSKASSARALQLVRTLLHEYIHADMFRKLNTANPTSGDLAFIETYNSFKDNKFEPTPGHETMAKLYVNEMKEALKNFHKNVMVGDYNYLSDNGQISLDDFYEALAWQGLKNHGVQAWEILPQSRKDEINTALSNYVFSTTANCP